MKDEAETAEEPRSDERRRFLKNASTAAMGAGLAGGYGALGLVAGRFLYPARPAPRRWFFVCEEKRLGAGESLLYQAPSGETINVVRREGDGELIALSSTCPHLGCQVHWEAQNERYFCPCHNGTFDADGVGTGGPPGDAQQVLPRYPMKVDNGLLFIEVPVSELAVADDAGGEVIERAAVRQGPGHDPCLTVRPVRPVRRRAPARDGEDKEGSRRWT